MNPITRDVLHNGPLTPGELRVMKGREGSLNVGEVEGHAPGTLRLKRVDARKGSNVSVMTQPWELDE